jgi:hypothetical protein
MIVGVIVMDSEFEWMWKEQVVLGFKVLYTGNWQIFLQE